MINFRLNRHDWLYLIALLLWLVPVAALLPIALWWLWQSGNFLWWLGAMLLCAALGLGLQTWLRRRDRRLLAEHETQPNPDWTPHDQAAGNAIEDLAAGLKPEDWPLDERLWLLGRDALERVARTYHPEREQPLLELTLPHGLLILERASRELRIDLANNIPFSHRLTIGDLLRINRWKRFVEQGYALYRAGRLVFNPASAILSEAKSALGSRTFEVAWTDLRRWLLQEYVRKIGQYAIELYSGRLVLDEHAANAATAQSIKELEREGAAAAQRTEEPLRILILGRANAGKSSLINALFDQLLAATDCLPDLATPVIPYRLARDGLTPALIFDTPGLDTAGLPAKVLDPLVDSVDLILWVTPAQRPDREQEAATLSRLRQRWAAHPEHHPPTLLVAVSHIDLLRPRQEWQPPYDLNAPASDKARNIRAAVEAVAQDLEVPLGRVIPVCLAEGRAYNVTDSLWAAILDHQSDANRVRLLRLREAQKKVEDWALLRRQLASTGRFLLERRQLASTGRFLLELPDRLLN